MKDKINRTLRCNLGLVLAVFAIVLAIAATVIAVSAEYPVLKPDSDTAGESTISTPDELIDEYNRKNQPVLYAINANDIGIEKMVIPVRTDALIDVHIAEDGYYKVFASQDANTGCIPIILKYDENGVVTEHSSPKEDSSVLMMYLQKGDYNFSISNNSFNDDAQYYFNAELCEKYIESFDFKNAVPIDFYTEVKVKPAETKVLKIENTKDSYTNFVCAEGDSLSVEIFDGNLVSCGYDSTKSTSKGGICQCVVMHESGTDFYYAVVSNSSQQEVTVTYETDLRVYCKDCRTLEPDTPTPLSEDTNCVWGQGVFWFTPDETKEYDFSFASFTDVEITLLVRDMNDYSNIAFEQTGHIRNGSLSFDDITLEKGTDYAVIIDMCADDFCNPNVLVE